MRGLRGWKRGTLSDVRLLWGMAIWMSGSIVAATAIMTAVAAMIWLLWRRPDNAERSGCAKCCKSREARWKKMLGDYEAPALDPGVAESLESFVAARKAAEPDSFT